MGAANSTVAEALRNSPAASLGAFTKSTTIISLVLVHVWFDGLEEMARALHPEAFKQ
jgi:hypothetical protein